MRNFIIVTMLEALTAAAAVFIRWDSDGSMSSPPFRLNDPNSGISDQAPVIAFSAD